MVTRAKILIVDDHEMVREGVRALLSREPAWEVCGEASSGREALALSLKTQPDVVIMDLLIPDLNGMDAARQLRKMIPSAAVLILSAHEDPEMIRAAFDAGVRAYLFKSQTRAHLVPAITALVDGQSYLTAEVSEALLNGLQSKSGDAGADAAPTDPGLTPRERETIQLLAEGRSNKEIAAALFISVKTVETHRAALMRKLNVDSLSELVRYAIRAKIIDP
jgi:DNA-binding NarL/FixJ family response regulator